MKNFGFGLMRLPVLDEIDRTKIDYEELNKMVDEFIGNGFTYFDTAYVYHDTFSEIAFRECVVKRYPREAYTIATKLPTMILKSREHQEKIFQKQLENCGVEYFDYYLVHNINKGFLPIARELDSFNFVRGKKAEGKIKNIGFSFHGDPEMLDQLLTELSDMDFVQLQVNYLDWDDDNVRAGECVKIANKHGKPIIVMEPVKGGTLATVPAQAEKLMKECEPDMSPASWAVRYAAGVEGVFMVLSGMGNVEQVKDNVSYMKEYKPLNDGEQEMIKNVASIIKSAIAIPCTGCRYCEKTCPQSIPIATYFDLYNADQISLNDGFSPHMVYYMNKVLAGSPRASQCIECRACESQCPQNLPIVDWLKNVSESFDAPAP